MKLTTDAYEFTIGENLVPSAQPRFTITLVETGTGKIKEFTTFHGSLDGHLDHMNSLTDDLCSSWFRDRPEKKGKMAQKAGSQK